MVISESKMLSEGAETRQFVAIKDSDLDNGGRRSCEFSNQSAYCVKKASAQLNKLHDNLVQFQQTLVAHELEVKAQTESKLLKFNEKNTKTHVPFKLQAISSGTALEVFSYEVDRKKPKESVSSVVQEDPKKAIFKMAEDQIDILNNVRLLIARMDGNCKELKQLLEEEQNRTNMLRETIDWHAYKRIHDLPMAVQKEHEKCAYDIQELKWHCAYQGRIEQRLREKVRQAENINKKILEEIEFVKENSPLIKEKQAHEKDSMKGIQEKQENADVELKIACEKLQETEEKFERFKKRAEQEEKFLADHLLSLSNELKSALLKFLKSQQQHEAMVKNIEQIGNKLAEEELKAKSLEKSLKDVQERQTHFEDESKRLSENIMHEEIEHKRLVEENEVLKQRKREREIALEEMRDILDISIQEKTRELQRLLKANRSSQKEIQSLRRRMENSEKQKLADMKSVQRAITEREKVLSDLQLIKEETDQARLIHENLMLTLDQERERSIDIEENLSIQTEALKKQNKSENHARMVLQARINADTAEFEKGKKESEKKKDKLVKAEEDVKAVLGTVNAQVDKIEEKYNERIKVIDGLNNVINQLSEKFTQLKTTLTTKINDLEPKEMNLKENLSDLGAKEKEMENTSALLEKKLRDMASSSVVMNKLLLGHQSAIEELNEEITELQIQLDCGQELESNLRRSLKEVQERSRTQGTKHQTQMENRRQTLIDLQEDVNNSLKKNNELALCYVDLQSKHIDQKNRFLSAYEKSLIAQDSLADKESLCELHSRLHDALTCYYQLRGMQTKAGLSRFEEMTRKSDKKLMSVQNALEVATSNISAFLSASNQSHKFLKHQYKVGKKPVNLSA